MFHGYCGVENAHKYVSETGDVSTSNSYNPTGFPNQNSSKIGYLRRYINCIRDVSNTDQYPTKALDSTISEKCVRETLRRNDKDDPL
jgi:hypothetical protein